MLMEVEVGAGDKGVVEGGLESGLESGLEEG